MSYLLFGLADWRDVIVIAAGSMLILVLLALFVFTAVLGMATWALIRTLRSTLRDQVSPLLDSAQQTIQTVRGTATFVSETTVRPIIRVYGVVAGARRAAGVIMGITSRRDGGA